jgi:hypothetical protein
MINDRTYNFVKEDHMNNHEIITNTGLNQKFPFGPPPIETPQIDYGLFPRDVSDIRNIRNAVIYVWLKTNREF